MVQALYYQISLHQVELEVDLETGSVRDNRFGVDLPCDINDSGCTLTVEGTYFWDRDPRIEECPLYQARHVRGIMVTNEGKDDDKAFLSRDGSLVRLLLTGTKAMCDRLVWTTSHPQLYLSADFDHPAFARPIDPRDVSIHTFSLVGDAYLYGALSDNIRQETQALYTRVRRVCRSDEEPGS